MKFIVKNGMTYNRLLAVGFLTVILVGALLLSLPFSSRSGETTPFINALFTSTSATCVTGLIIYDTWIYWSPAGQFIILCLIQIGGIGFMTVITLFFLVFNKKIGLHERKMIQASAGSLKLSGIVKLVRRIIVGTFLIELSGALLLTLRFRKELGGIKGLWYGFFHGVSAFCNAGFDLMGYREPFGSLTHYRSDPLVNLVIMGLIVVGGVGFLVWNDVYEKGWRFHAYSLHSKIVVVTTALLIAGGTLFFWWFEYHHSMEGFPLGERVLSSLFMSVTPRTAGFNTLDLPKLSDAGSLLTVLLMFIGGSPGSTAGGIKTSTFAIMVLGILHMARGNRQVSLYKKSLELDIYRRATAILGVYLIGILGATMLLSHIDSISLRDALFETASAAGTVGLSMGITPKLSSWSKLILIFLMYGGRLGGFTLMTVFAERQTETLLKRPSEKIMIG